LIHKVFSICENFVLINLRKTFHHFSKETKKPKMGYQWGDDETEETAVVPQAPGTEPVAYVGGTTCHNPLCGSTFPIANTSCFESRMMSHVRDVTWLDPETLLPDVRYYCPNKKQAAERAIKIVAQLKEAQSHYPSSHPKYTSFTRRILQMETLQDRSGKPIPGLGKLYAHRTHDCYEQACFAEEKNREFQRTGKWNIKPGQLTEQEFADLESLAASLA
jgi:hypothetical protein